MKKVFTLTKSIQLLLIVLFTSGLMISSQVSKAQFTDGNICAFKNTATSALGSTGTAVVVEEYSPTIAGQTAPVSTGIAMPTTVGTPNKRVVCGGTTSSNGAMTRSENGRYLVVPGYDNNIGDANGTYLTLVARTVDGGGNIGTGIQGTQPFSAANDYRGATSDDGTHFWLSGGSKGVYYSPDGTAFTLVSTTSTNTRVVNIFNGQLFYSTSSGTTGIYKVSNGEPTTAGANVSTIQATPTAPYGFSVSPDGLTIYAINSTSTVVRYTYSGTYNPATFTYSGGTWSTNSTGFTLSGVTGLAVDWMGYTFSTGANGAKVYACNTSTLVGGPDNGTAAITTTTLRTLTGNNAFKQIAFAPIKQTVSIGTNTPATGNLTAGATSVVLFQFNLAANEGNSTIKNVVVHQNGTLTAGADITNFSLIYDANGNGIVDGTEGTTPLASGTVSGSNITFSSISQANMLQGTSNNYLVIGDISATPGSGTFIPQIVSNKIINSVNYTFNITNAGGTPVTGSTITGNTLTYAAATPTISVGALTPGGSFSASTGTPSSPQTFSLGGSSLSSNLTLSGVTGYQYSDDGGTNWTADGVGLSYSTSSVSKTISVRLSGTSQGTFNGTINIVSTGATNSPATITLSGSVTDPTPVITVTPATVAGLISTIGSTNQYTEGTYVVSGSILGTTNIDITAPTNVEVSLTYGTGYSGAVSLIPVSGVVANTTIYVRIKNTASAGVFSAVNITNTAGVTTKNVAVSGTVLAAPVPFTPGNLVFERMGGTTSVGTLVYLDEYTNATPGTLVQSILMPASASASSSNRRLLESGSATSDGALILSLDGQYLSMTGYDTTVATTGIASATEKRIVGRVDYNGNINTTTMVKDGFSGNNIRSACSIDGTAFWTSGAGTATDGGLRYIQLGGTSSIQMSTSPVNDRIAHIYENQLCVTSASSPGNGVNVIGGSAVLRGSGIPTTAGQTTNNIIVPPAVDNYGFLMLDADPTVPGPDLVYICNNAGGLLKYSYNGTTWTARGSLLGTTLELTGKINGSSVDLYVLSGSGAQDTVYKITDTNAFNANIVGSGGRFKAVGSIVAVAPAGAIFRGVSFAPVALPATPAVNITSAGPADGPIHQGESDDVLYQLNLSVSGANAILSGLTLTTGGSYITSDFIANSFKLRYSTDNTLDATDPTIGIANVVASGGTIAFNIAQPIVTSATGYLFLTVDVIGSATIGHTIQVTSTSLSNISFADNATKTGAAAAGGVQTIFSSILPTVFYSNGGNLDDINNWGDQTDGTILSAGPANFTTNGYIFNVANGSTTIGSNWTVSGTNSKVVVQTGQSFTVPASFSFTGTVDVQANGTLNLLNSVVPAFGILDVASNVTYGAVSGAQNVTGADYGNLTITGAGTKIITGVFNVNPINVFGQLLLNNTTVDRSLSTFQQISFYNDFTVQGAVTFNSGFKTDVDVEAKGTADQHIVGNGNTIYFGRLYMNIDNNGNPTNLKPSGSLSLSTTGGATNLVLSDDLKLNCGNASPANTATFADNGNSITTAADVEVDGTNANYSLTGALVLTGATGTVNIRQNGGVSGSASAPVATFKNISIQTSGNTITQIQPATGSATINILGNLTIGGTSTGKFTPNGNTIKIGGNLIDSRNVDMIAAGTSTFEFNGSSLQTISTAFVTGESFFNVKINNPGSVQLAGTSGAIKITGTGNLNLSNGTLVTNAGKVILNNTATITESTTSYVIGTVTSTRTLTANTNETFGGMGIEVDALGIAPGNTVATRITGAALPIGCRSSSILRYFTLAPTTNTGLNATIVFHYLASNFEMNGFNPSNLAMFNSTNNGTSWNSLVSANNAAASTVTVSGQASLNRYSASTDQPIGGMVTPVNSIVCPSPNQGSVTLTSLGATGALNWQSSADNSIWSNINGATTATYTASPSVKTYYRLIANFPGCPDFASTSGIVELSSPTITITATSVTDNSITLNWSPAGTGNYAISYSGTSSGTQTSVTPPKTITGLSSSGTYDFTLTQTGTALSACSASGTLTGVNTQCGAPTGVTANSPAASQILVSWTGVPTADYRVYYRPLFSFGYYFTKDVIGASSVLLTKQGNNNLYGSNTYEIYVSRLNCPSANAVGAGSNFLDVTTLPAEACATPVIDSVRSVCPVQLEVFIHHNPAVSDYNVYIQRETPSILAVNSYGISSDYFTINTPYSGEQFLIAVDARCSASSVSTLKVWPGNVTVKPLCASPANLVLSSPACHGFTASWNADQCISNNASAYAIYLRVAGTINFNSYGASLPANGLSPYKVVNWLTSGRNYQVFVRSLYSCNGFITYGQPSQTLTIATLSSGCRDEEDSPVQDETPAVQQASPDNSEVLSLYPNPNNGQFEVNLSSLNTDDQQVRIEVMNMLGQTVVTHFSTIEAGQYNEYVKLPSAITSGTYIVRVTVGKNIYTSKINVSK